MMATLSPPSPQLQRTASYAAPILVGLITFIAFLPCLQNDFVNWDDEQYLLTTPFFRGFTWDHLYQMFTRGVAGHYQPLVWLSHAVDYAFWGLNPRGYHLTSILLHAINTILFARLIENMLALAMPLRAEETPLRRRWISCLAALLFGVHPLRVESVAWASERRDVLSGLFILLTLLVYIRNRQSGPIPSRGRWLLAACLLYGAALASKAIAIPLLGVFVLLDVYPLGRLPADPRCWLRHRYRNVWLEKLCFLAPATVAALGVITAQCRTDLFTLEQHGLLSRLAVCAYGLMFYLYKTLLPIRLLPLYELRLPIQPLEWPYIAGAAGTTFLSIIAVVIARRWPALLISWLCYIFFLSPVLGLFQNGPQLVADRYTYLACLGWVVLIAAGMVRGITSWGRNAFRAATGALVLILGVLGALTWQQCKIWRTSETLWAHTLRHDPLSTIAGGNLAMYYYHHDRPDDFVRCAQKVMQLKEQDPILELGLGDILGRKGRYEEAAAYYKSVLARPQIKAFAADAHNGLATTLVNLGRLPEALPHFLEALKIDPQLAAALNHLETLSRAYPNDPQIRAALQDARRIVEQGGGVSATPPQ